MDDRSILDQVNELVHREHELRSQAVDGSVSREDEHAELARLEQQLDQCWDLLRQRRARAGAGQNPDGAAARPVGEVEDYLN